jgi:prepilin-type N-terminal cleavage/methylation domain-containing protein
MNNDRRVSQFGFSLLELVIVVAIIIIVAAIAVPAISRTIANYQLKSSGTAVASMLEAARLTAIKTNQPYYALYNRGGCLNVVCAVSANGSPNPPDGSNYTFPDPTVTTSGSVSLQNIATVASPPNHDQLDSYLGGNSVQLELSVPIGFNGRGVPCMASAATPFLCQQLDPVAGGIPAFEWFMQNSTTQSWVAVTVSPAGRIRSWRLVSSKNTNCGFKACWE